MPTTLPKRRPVPRDRRLELALLALLCAELVTLRSAGAETGIELVGTPPSRLTALLGINCTAAAVPCALLAP